MMIQILDDISLRNVVKLITCVIQGNCKFYSQKDLEEGLLLA